MKVRIICMTLLAAGCLSWVAFSSDIHSTPKQTEAIARAMQQKDTPQLIKTLITHMKGELEKDYDRFPALIGEVEKYTTESTDPATTAILHSMTAEMYNQYYQQNRWNISRRTNLSGYTPEDIREWTANLFTDKIKAELVVSLEPAALLQQTPSSRYKEIMESGKDTPVLRPTLYDFLISRAIDIQPTDSLYQEWLAFRKTQPEQKAQLLVELQYLQYAYQAQATEQASKQYETSLDSLLNQYVSADYSTEIQIARIQALETTMHRVENRDSVIALQYAICKETIARYPKYERIGILQNKLADLEAPTLFVEVPNTVYPGENLSFKTSFRHVNTIRVELYESRRMLSNITLYGNSPQQETKGKLVKAINFPVNASIPYNTYDSIFQIPGAQPGLYECVISVPGHQLKTSHWISVTRLASVHRINGGQTEMLVTDFKSGQPIPQATVTWFSGQQRNLKTLGSVKTDKDGLAIIPRDSKITASHVVVGPDTASRYNLSHPNIYPQTTETTQTTVSLFTDRGIYRPGQTVFFKGIAYLHGTDQPQVVSNQTYTVILRDVNHKEVATQTYTTNAFGSFNGEFTLPAQTLNGSFALSAGDYSVAYFQVEEYKRPTFTIELDTIRNEVAFGDDVTIHGKALTFSGVSLTEGEVAWRIVRYPLWLRIGRPYGSEQVAEGKTNVSADGTFSLTFRPEKRETGITTLQHFYTYEVSATVTDSKGETQESRSFLSVGDTGFVLSCNLPDKAEKDSVSLRITAQTINGQETSATGTWKLITLEENKDKTEHPALLQALDYKEGGTVAKGTFTTGQIFDRTIFRSLPSDRYRLILQAKDNRGKDVSLEQDVILYSKTDKKPPISAHFWVIEEKTTCLPGEETSFILGTSDKDAYILYEIFSQNKLLARERMKLTNENKRFSLPFSDKWGDGAVAVFTFVKEGELHDTYINLYRKQPDRQLTIKPITFRDRLAPGTKESWTFRIQATDSAVVNAEVMAGMYDASLDKLMSFNWSFNPIRQVYLQAPHFFADEGFRRNYGSTTEQPRFIQQTDYLFDRLDWQGIMFPFYPRFNTPAVKAYGETLMKSNSAQTEAMAADEEEGQAVFLLAEGEVKKEEKTQADLSTIPVQLRQNFNETAFFYPTLRTNEAGDVLIQFTLPESNTTWKLQTVAHTKDLKHGQLTKEVISSKPFMVIPNLPRFLREDDQVTISAQLLNQLDREISGKVRLEFFDPATDKPIDGWNQPEQPFSLTSKSNGTVAWTVTTPKDISLVGCRIVAEGTDGSDGEQHLLPILSNRILVTESTPIHMLQPGEKTIRITEAKGSREPFRLTMELTANPIWYAVQALPTMTQPENDNILSWFASYYSNALATYIASAHPRVQRIINLWTAQGGNASTLLSNLEKNEELKNILLEETPWVLAADNETEQKQRLTLLFDMNRAANLRDAALRQLVEQQTVDGGWSWFKGFYTDRTITLAIVKGMQQLEQQKAVQWNDTETTILKNAVSYLDNCIRKDFAELKKNDKQWQKANPSPWQLTYLFVRSGIKDMALSAETQEAIRFYTAQATKEWTKLSYAGKAETALLAQRNGDKTTAAAILTWLRKTATTSEELGMYWANNRRGDDFFNSPIDTHCLLMETFNELSQDSQETGRMKQWLLNQKRTQNWGTAPSNISAIYALLLTGSDWLTQDNTLTAQWGDRTFTSGSGETATGYIKASVEGKEITANTNTLVLRKEGNAPAWGAVYNQYFETLDKVNTSKGMLNVEKKLFVETNNGTERQLRPVSANVPLQVGNKVIVRLTIRTDRDMDYVALKDLRAGCFEPAQVLSGYNYRDGAGYYQSPKDVSENFFFTQLPKGTYVLEYPVYVSRAGDYTGGISTIQCMYAPEFTSHTAGERIRVNN